MDTKLLSGLQIMQMMSSGELPMPSICETMGMKPHHVEKGQVSFLIEADKRHLNPMGGVHGGFFATALDSVTGCALHTMLEAGDAYGTLDLQVKMLKPIEQNVELIAQGSVVSVGRTVGVANATIKDKNGVIYAYGNASLIIKRSKS